MGIIDNTRLLVKVCQMYYIGELNQKEISERLGISRPQICRILSAAKEKGIVSISIQGGFEVESTLEQQLVSRFPIKDALVFDLSSVPKNHRLGRFGALAAEYVESILIDSMRIGVMSGQTISSIVSNLGSVQKKNLEIVPLMGGLGFEDADIHANSIAQKFAKNCGGRSYVLNAPVIVRDRKVKEALLNEQPIRFVLELGENSNISLLGIGNVTDFSTPAIAGQWSEFDRHELIEKDVTASICNTFLNSKGEIVNTSINERSIGQSLESISNSKKIGFAFGNSKFDAIHASLLSGLFDVLVTDTDTSMRLIK